MRSLFLAVLFLGISQLTFSQIQRDSLHKLQSKSFNDLREIKVHLPKDMKKDERLPVVFVFDAQWDPYYKLITSTVDYLTEIKEFPRSIVVGINNKKRQYELTPAPVNEDWKVPNLGGAKLLENHLMNEVIPFLKKEYNSGDYRIGLGHSLGGTFVLNSLVDNSSLFDAYIAISPNLQLDDEEITLKIQRNLSALTNKKAFFYVTMGTEGGTDTQFLPPIKKLDAVMKAYKNSNFKWNFAILEGYHHGTTPLTSIQAALLAFSKTQKKKE